jgi:hypothetical protein
MKTLKQLMSAAILSILASTAVAQTVETTPNLVTNTRGTSGTGVWLGTGGNSQLNGVHPLDLWGCCTSYSGSSPFFDTSTTNGNGDSGQIIWSYGNVAVNYIIGINTALANAGTGIQINGYNWRYDVRNMNGGSGQSGVDTLTATSRLWNSTYSTVLLQQSRTHNTTMDWTTFSSTVTAATPYPLASVGNLALEFRASDSGFWNGYYGPQIRDVRASFNYSVDQCVVNPQSSPTCPGYKTYYNMWDDGYAQVNLPFAFPFYGRTFTTSYMFTNGVIGFLDTNLGGYCCDGIDLNQQRFAGSSPWNFAIYALNTDLDVGTNSQFYTQKTDNGTGLRYTWENVVEIGTNNENTFSVNIKDSGYIGINYEKVNLSPWRNPLIGIAGDVSQGQYNQYYYGPASNLPNMAGTTLQYSGTETTDACAINPLINPSCPGYQQAYFNQQCSINALYDTACPGYAAAYLTYQCNASQLYSPNCPGYQQAYLDQQCSINSLFSSSCQGYQTAQNQCSIDPLSNTLCQGYQTAVTECSTNGLLYTYCPTYQTELNYCSTDPLFNNLCPTYQAASTQCSANPLTAAYCPNYQSATTQCSSNPLTAAYCPNYQTATLECAANPLTAAYCPTYQTASASCAANTLNHSYCPGYQTVLNACSSNPLSNSLCSGYTAASNACSANQLTYTYCPSYTTAIAACSTNPQGNTMCPGYSSTASSSESTSNTVIATAPVSDPVASAAPLVADPVVNQSITATATSASPAQAATATVPLVSKPEPAAAASTIVAAATEEKKEETKEETKSTDSGNASTATASTGDQKKDQPKTMRQQIQEQRVAAARAKAVEAGKELANKMGEAASMEAQVAVQNVVIQAMGFTPGFDAYNRAVLPDAQGYRPFEIYPGQRVIDNPQGRRFMTGSDRLHQDMVDQQYTRSE